MSPPIKFITGAIGLGPMMVFVFGLSHSISTGFAGFRGGLLFMCIVIFVLGLALCNSNEEAIRKDRK